MSNEELLDKYGKMTVVEMMKMIEQQSVLIKQLKKDKEFAEYHSKELGRERRISEDANRGYWGIYG